MSKILKLDPNVDLWLSYSWSTNNHGICGHTFEVIDYFWILKDTFNVWILLCEDIDETIFRKSISEKYDFTTQEIDDIVSKTVFNLRPTVVMGKNILFTDGGLTSLNRITLLFKNIFLFACSNFNIKDNIKENVWILQDDRVYDAVKLNGINYKKRILFDRLKNISNTNTGYHLLYLTKNCRKINFETFNEIKDSYGDKLLCAVNTTPLIMQSNSNIKYIEVPIKNLWEKFDTYIYTPVERKWDCSPRFIAECKWYNKKVEYFNIDYWEEDKGLYWRDWDIQNDFSSLELKKDDEIINILRSIINV